MILLLLINSCTGLAQLSAQAKQIKDACKVIDEDSSFLKKIYEQEEFMNHATDNGGTLTVYHKNGIVHKMTEWVGLSNYIVIIDYYFQAGKLVYVRDEELMYERNPVTGETTGKISKENRFLGEYFFRNNKLFEEKSLGHNRFEDDEQNNAEKEFVAASKRYLVFFKRL
ncbi:MAG: hypothetical protein K2Q24_10905 [Chitinophagaceae bacterium]|nr:hypothetical protein [Chitinophagaceae bacterium]